MISSGAMPRSLEVAQADAGLATGLAAELAADPAAEAGCAPVDTDGMTRKAEEAAAFLKALSHEGRLMILCYLTTGEKSVSELEALLEWRQAAVSQQLARLRLEGLVSCRRDGKAIYYAIADDRARRMVGLVYELFCGAA